MPASSSFRLRWPLLVLLASIGLTAFAAFDAQRTVRGQHKVIERAINEFSSFAAWSYSEHLNQQLALASAEVIGAVNHGSDMHSNPRVPGADDLVHYLPTDPRCDCHRARAGPNPVAFFAFKLGTTSVDFAHNSDAGPAGDWRVGTMHRQLVPPVSPYSDADRRWIADTLNFHAR